MDGSLRKRPFMSPFSISRATEKSKLSPQQGQRRMPSLTPTSTSGAEVSKSDSIMCSNRSQGKCLNSMDPTREGITERAPRQKVCRSLFSIKPTSFERKSYIEQQSYLEKQGHPEKGQIHKMCTLSRRDFLGTDIKNTSILFAELSIPKLLSEANFVNSTPDCIMQELLGQPKKVEVHCPFDLCDLLKPEAIRKFRSAITPRKADLSRFGSLMDASTNLMISYLDSEDSCNQDSRLPRNKETFVQVGETTSSGLSNNIEYVIRGESGSAKSKDQTASLCDSMLPTSRKRMIRGFSVPRCGRLSNQSYQEQAKEFQEILSSKVRQVAEVADCLQHKELLYKVLQM